MFVEKPLSVVPPEKMRSVVDELQQLSREKKLVISVGYMFRYLAAIEKMRSILREEGERRSQASREGTEGDPMKAVVAVLLLRYNSAYSAIRKSMW